MSPESFDKDDGPVEGAAGGVVAEAPVAAAVGTDDKDDAVPVAAVADAAAGDDPDVDNVDTGKDTGNHCCRIHWSVADIEGDVRVQIHKTP